VPFSSPQIPPTAPVRASWPLRVARHHLHAWRDRWCRASERFGAGREKTKM
ncbi:MAG: hypothetical protein AVDCRST_MAG18-2111, partial [uncultured Thermomicrobiales bacterium]